MGDAEPAAADPATEKKPEEVEAAEAPAEAKPEQKVEKKKSGSFLRARNKTPEKKAPEPSPAKEEAPAPPPAQEPAPAQEVAKKKSGSFFGAKAKAPETSPAPGAEAIAAPEQKVEKKKPGSFFKQGGKGSAPSKPDPPKQPEAITEEGEAKGGDVEIEEKKPKKKGSFFQKKENPDEVDEAIAALKASKDRSAEQTGEGSKKAEPQPSPPEKKSLKFTGKKDSSINSPAPELGVEEEVSPPKKGGLFACCMGGGGILEESMLPTRGIDKKGSVFTQKSSRKSASIEVAVTMDAANVTKDIQKIKARKALVHDQRNDQGADVDVTVKSSHKTTSLYFGEALKKKGKGAAVKELKKDDVRTKIKTAVRADVEEFETSRATVFEQQLLLYDVLWSCLKEKFDEGEKEVARAISGLESYNKVLGSYASGLTNVKEMTLPIATDDGDEPAPLNDLSELVASWQGHVGAAANDLVAIVNAGVLEKEVAAAQDALTTCTQDLTYDSEESVALLKYTHGMVKAAHEKFLTSVNQHLGDSGMHTATEDDDIHELDVKDDLWLLDMNYRFATGALHDVFVDTRETFAAVLVDFKAAEAKRLEAIQRASSAFANAQKDMLPGVEQVVMDHAKHGGKASTKGESEIQEDLMNQVQAAIMAVQDTAAARMITMEAIEAAASPTAGDALLDGLAPLDSPLSTPLVVSAVVFEAKHAKWPTKDEWCSVLGVRTRDKYMHIFFLPGEFDAGLSADDALRQITPALELKHDKKGKATAPKVNAKVVKPDFTLSVADSGGQADQTADGGAIIKITELIKKKERLLSVRGLPDKESEFWKTHVSATAAAEAAATSA